MLTRCKNVIKSVFYVKHLKALTELKLTPSGSLFEILITRSEKKENVTPVLCV